MTDPGNQTVSVRREKGHDDHRHTHTHDLIYRCEGFILVWTLPSSQGWKKVQLYLLYPRIKACISKLPLSLPFPRDMRQLTGPQMAQATLPPVPPHLGSEQMGKAFHGIDNSLSFLCFYFSSLAS